jgi:hypothetical protein
MTSFSYQFYTKTGKPKGKVKQIEFATGLYAMAAIAICAHENKHPADEPVIKIWCESVLPDYGPYFYQIYLNPHGGVSERTVVFKD